MPNTLAHMGVQVLSTRLLIPGASIKWIYMGAVIPDVPFILKRIIEHVASNVDSLDIKLVSIAQSSLSFSVVLAFALSRFSREANRVFLILCLGIVMHLLLDACQIKWGNGASFLVPFSWKLTQFELFWPEQWPSHVMTGVGVLVTLVLLFRPKSSEADDLILPGWKVLAVSGFAIVAYFVIPVALMGEVEDSGSGGVKVIRLADRSGSLIELDRKNVYHDGDGYKIQLDSREPVTLTGIDEMLPEPGKLSVKGIFQAHEVVHARQYHLNDANLREIASIAGLGFVAIYWLLVLYIRLFKLERDQG